MATLMTDEVTNVFLACSGLGPALNDGALLQATFLFFSACMQALCINSQFSSSSQVSEVMEHFAA